MTLLSKSQRDRTKQIFDPANSREFEKTETLMVSSDPEERLQPM